MIETRISLKKGDLIICDTCGKTSLIMSKEKYLNKGVLYDKKLKRHDIYLCPNPKCKSPFIRYKTKKKG